MVGEWLCFFFFQAEDGIRDVAVTGVQTCALPIFPTSPTDYWPNVLFDPREGNPRDTVPAAPNNVRPTLGGVMHYVELDLNNLGRWLTGAIGTSGTQAKDVTNATHDFLIYFSDRRTNY